MHEERKAAVQDGQLRNTGSTATLQAHMRWLRVLLAYHTRLNISHLSGTAHKTHQRFYNLFPNHVSKRTVRTQSRHMTHDPTNILSTLTWTLVDEHTYLL